MGRRKIEIKAIKDDRNRSVTFLKRKGGLFKKAHELSVLCKVDVAVIIFGHNKKLYEFSSNDINETIGRFQYYGGAHEHKGPEDFMGKKEGDDEDEEDEIMGGSPPRDSHTPPEHMMPHPHLHNQAAFQHMRNHAPSASPPIGNGQIPFHNRHSSPAPPGISRPNSRAAHIRRQSSNLVPPHHQQQSQAPLQPDNYAFVPNPPFYNPQAAQGMPAKGTPGPPGPPPQFQYPQVQQFLHQQQQEHRRQSMPPAFPQDNRSQSSMPHPSPPQPQPPPQQNNMQNQFQSPPLPQPKPLPSAAKQHSIFTPIEDSRSMLAQHWGNSNNIEAPRPEGPVKLEMGPRSQSIDVASMARAQANGHSPPQPRSQLPPNQPQRTASTSSVPNFGPPSRTNSMQTDPKRPKLTVQIPSEHSDAGSATADSSPKESGTTGATPARTSTVDSHSSGVLLPPPSPSANSLMSAGATGPPNPFARPPPPGQNNSYGSRNEMETPSSALPSHFVEGILPSPSNFYAPWTPFSRESNNMLPSPLTFQTPVVPNGPSFGREDPTDRKRKPSEESDSGATKRMKG